MPNVKKQPRLSSVVFFVFESVRLEVQEKIVQCRKSKEDEEMKDEEKKDKKNETRIHTN